MALFPTDLNKRERMQPGFDGKRFGVNMPGYRDGAEDRINRTNNYMNTSEHDVPNIKYMFDDRLPVLFRYGFAHGYNQMVIPKGRLVAVDPNMDLVDFDMQKKHSTLTLANGGIPVRLRKEGDKWGSAGMVSSEAAGQKLAARELDRHEWAPLKDNGLASFYQEKCFKPLKESAIDQMGEYKVSEDSGRVVDSEGNVTTVRVGNVPIGIIERNEYTRDDDALNGMMPGPVLTDAMIELPWFSHKDKAEQNPWGSAYGPLKPGMLVRSDENGRFVPSALSFPELVKGMDIAEYEAERQQVVGQVYAVNTELVPEGAAKWATWALEDRLNSEEFNPSVYAKTNRRGEDAVSNTPRKSNGMYPGYPYDKNYLNHDLHMLASSRIDMYDARMNPEYQYSDLGIPGLTDGKNVFAKERKDVLVGRLFGTAELADGKHQEFQEVFLRIPEINLVENSLKIKIGESEVPAAVGAPIATNFKINYVSEAQGLVSIVAKDQEEATLKAIAQQCKDGLEVFASFKKAGLAGVPTFMDWDGAVGSVKVLLTK